MTDGNEGVEGSGISLNSQVMSSVCDPRSDTDELGSCARLYGWSDIFAADY